uniref:NADH-ubiquinone oxidoreductase chain 5 n=1 Tax=Lepidocyrtus fimetarius TaxID=2583952 RepID=A0A6G8FFJ1_9HEXA|nr:NADH dehydrogenase subunit 5 [Lepidocyrtus fimetarius]QIM14972.1 NADH dehydrogenase subunit 5 [Lepidocyrtus fimetarius]
MFLFRLLNFYLGLMLMFSFFCFSVSGVIFNMYEKVMLLEWEIFSFLGVNIIMTLLLDWVSLTFTGLVMFISSLVLIYSFYYMSGDKYIVRFTLLVYLFVLSMILMIISPNMISILLGWDGLGLVSYCLVIYYQSFKSNNSGMLTILSNRVGDVAILLSIAWMLDFGSWNFFYFQHFYLGNYGFVLMMVVLAAMTKSAQIPFSAWLPAAMAAPTPVSALVHSSTLVTAGVYLLIRFNYLLGNSSFLLYMGSLTMFMSGLGANFEGDLKKIIALSTLSQLGVMMFVLSLGFYELAFFHLMTHALFKSLLFLCAGSFIHGCGDIQDVRFFGGIYSLMPVSSMFFIGCSISLCGFPFMSGFYSKDLILEVFMMMGGGVALTLIIVLGTLFTVTYSMRLIIHMFFKNMGVLKMITNSESYGMVVPMGILFMFSVIMGSYFSWLLFPSYSVFLPYGFKCFFLLMIFIMSALIYLKKVSFVSLSSGSVSYFYSNFFGSMWFMPLVSTYMIMGGLRLGEYLVKNLDQSWVEYLGGQGTFMLLSSNSSILDFNSFSGMKMYFLGFFFTILVSLFFI